MPGIDRRLIQNFEWPLFTMTLLVGAGLMGRTILVIATTPLGFDDERVVKADLFLPNGRYRDASERRRGIERVLAAVGSNQAVRGVAVSLPDPLRTFTIPTSPVTAERGAAAADSGRPAAEFVVSPAYFDILEIPLLAGRRFTASDDVDAPPVVIVSRDLARALWPGEPAVGRRVRVGRDTVWRIVAGVVGEIREPVADVVRDADRVAVRCRRDRDAEAGLAVGTRDRRLRCELRLDRGDVAEPYRCPPG
jgi:hypothetical protein